MPRWLSKLGHLFTPEAIALLTGLSLFAVVASGLGAAAFVTYIPEDYFLTRAPGPMARARRRAPVRFAILWLLRQVFGSLLALAGMAMLVLPGQGLLTLFAALCVLEYPGKRRLLNRLVRKRLIRAALNGLRRRRGLPPLRFDCDAGIGGRIG